MLWPWSWGLLCLALLLGDVRAGVLDIQDDDPGMVYSGTWFPDASPNAHGKHETWTNASGASVYYDFQGSLVQVFATMRPIGSYLTNVSFQIDDNAPDFWVTTENVTQETFNKLVYTSPGTLSTDGLHRITITNYGFVFWLVYLEITTPDATGTGTQTSSAGTSSSTSHVSNSSGSASRAPVIIGAVVGSVGGAALLLAALLFWCMHSKSRKRQIAAMAPTPFAGQADPSTHFYKDRPPPNPPSRFQRWVTGSSHVAATEPGYGYPSTGATENAPQERAQSEPADPEALKQLAVFRSAAEARAAPGAGTASLPLHPTRPPPAASIPSVLETPHPSMTQSPRSTGPVSRSGALARAFTFSSRLSSRLSRDPARPGGVPPSDATMNSALASSGVLPPSPYAPPSRSRPVFFRMLRRSRDGGVRLAGGAPQEVNADMMAPEEYDQRVLEAMSEVSTLPPEYQQYAGGEGERAPNGAGR
ncbi:hypothetical protein LXA43DRAFT_1097735 [Ganoderma leucocontextum]|nr:hypothetical protein LXA43DRAFT_1097735 [Ganoderma leucocontextum]